jgi:quercetin dioxygenase-like cupin family protein/DNA-binding XRE family transcriptional regulator
VPQPEEIAAALARNLRDLRRARQLSLDALAGLAGVSRGMLLQIEGQRVNPSLAMLVRIADALDVSVSTLVDLGAGAAVRVVRAADAVELWHGEHGGFGRLLVGSDRLDHLETWTWIFEPGEAHDAEAHPPGTREMLYVIAGRLTLEVDGERYQAETGDAVVFGADRDHRYANEEEHPMRLLMVVATPPIGWRGGGLAPG